MSLIIRWVINALALLIVSRILPGIHVTGFGAALIAVVIIGLVNALVKPILVILTLPLTIVTLGIFLIILNALMLWIAGNITPDFRVEGFGTAILGSILLSIVSTILHKLAN